eukprot:Clim_evm17s210 gene=Clim_evmTU17s210
MSSAKQPLPTIQGQKLKQKKRDIKEQYDPEGFRDAVVEGLNECDDFEAVAKFLDSAGNKLDYQRYGETLWDVLFAGGILAPGGSIEDEEAEVSKFYLFKAEDDDQAAIQYVDLFIRVMRRYRFLVKHLGEEVRKLLNFLKGFKEDQLDKLATAVSQLLGRQTLSADVLLSMQNEHLLKDGIALDMFTRIVRKWLQLNSIQQIAAALKQSEMDDRLLGFMPPSRQQPEEFETHFKNEKLDPMVRFFHAKQTSQYKVGLRQLIQELVHNEAPMDELVSECMSYINKYNLTKAESVGIVWASIMGVLDRSKKQDQLVAEALVHVKTYVPLLFAFSGTVTAEVNLVNRIQVFCFENISFLNIFNKIILLLYNKDVLGEDAITAWYESRHSQKGKGQFLKQMKPMMDWFATAEEESGDEA